MKKKELKVCTVYENLSLSLTDVFRACIQITKEKLKQQWISQGPNPNNSSQQGRKMFMANKKLKIFMVNYLQHMYKKNDAKKNKNVWWESSNLNSLHAHDILFADSTDLQPLRVHFTMGRW